MTRTLAKHTRRRERVYSRHGRATIPQTYLFVSARPLGGSNSISFSTVLPCLLVNRPTFVVPLKTVPESVSDGDGERVALTANLNRCAAGERWVELLCSHII